MRLRLLSLNCLIIKVLFQKQTSLVPRGHFTLCSVEHVAETASRWISPTIMTTDHKSKRFEEVSIKTNRKC